MILPLVFLKFWFWEAPIGLIEYFSSLNNAFLQLFSLPLFIRTYFKPLKNEYRQGLVLFSIVMGIFIKTVFIFIDISLLICLLLLELIFVLLFIAMPIIAVYFLIK